MRNDVKMIKAILNKYIRLKQDLQEFTLISSPLLDVVGGKSKKMVLKVKFYGMLIMN